MNAIVFRFADDGNGRRTRALGIRQAPAGGNHISRQRLFHSKSPRVLPAATAQASANMSRAKVAVTSQLAGHEGIHIPSQAVRPYSA